IGRNGIIKSDLYVAGTGGVKCQVSNGCCRCSGGICIGILIRAVDSTAWNSSATGYVERIASGHTRTIPGTGVYPPVVLCNVTGKCIDDSSFKIVVKQCSLT